MRKNILLKLWILYRCCKVFDDQKKLAREDMKYILEVGRKSPSSFGQNRGSF